MSVKLSVVITAYNEEKYISECIESVLNQTYKNLEIIVVDDGSKDNTALIADGYTVKDHRVHVVKKINGGSVSARKEGIKHATGEYITYIDGDDWLETDHYEKIMSKIDDADIIAFSLTCVYEGDRREVISNEADSGIYMGRDLNELKKKMLFSGDFGKFGLFPSMCAKVFRKSLIEDNLLNVHDDIRMGDDGACTYPSICDAVKVIVDNDIAGYLYRKTATGTITSSFNYIEFYRIENLYNVLTKAFDARKESAPDNIFEQLAFYLAFLYRTEMIQELSYLRPSNLLKKYKEISEIYKLKWVQYLFDNCEIIDSIPDKEMKIFISSSSKVRLFWNWYIVRKL